MKMIPEVPDAGRGVSSRQAGSDDYLVSPLSTFHPSHPLPQTKGFGEEQWEEQWPENMDTRF